MRSTRLALSAAVGFVCISMSAGSLPLSRVGTPPVNAYGAPTVGSQGEHLNYGTAQLGASPGASAPRPVAASPSSDGTPAIWSYTVFGTGIGYANVLIARGSDGRAEIYVGGCTSTFGLDTYWYALRYSPSSGNYDQVFVSEQYPSPIVRMALGDVLGDGSTQIVVALQSGEIKLYDQASHNPLPGFTTSPNLAAMVLHDLDGDGKAEVVVTTDAGLSVYSGGSLLWNVPGVGGADIAVGQMDADPALEIATTSGDVVDAGTHTVQWHWPDGFGVSIRAGDIDGDGRDEIVAASGWNYVWAYDVERQLPKWTLTASDHDIATIELVDVNCDGRPDLLVGEGQWGSIKAFDTVSQNLLWSIGNPYHGITHIAVGDVNGDGLDEILWGSGVTDTGPDHLYVAGLDTQAIEWSSLDLVGPILGPEVGDIDGDGKPELVALASLSDSGYGGARILVFDAATRVLRTVSDPVSGGFFAVEAIRLRNIDADPALEVLLGNDSFYDGSATALKFDRATNTFTQVWSSAVIGSSPFYSIEAADADGDGTLDVVAGSSGSAAAVYIFDLATGAKKWNSFLLGGNVISVLVESAGGGDPDILAIVDAGQFYAFDGTTKEALQITFGSFSAMATNPAPAVRSVYLGDTTGNVYRYDRGASSYDLAAAYPLGIGRIDGLTVLADGSFIVGAAGRLWKYASLSGPPSWSSADFGAPVGRQVALGAGPQARFFTGASLSLVEVAPGTDLASIAPSSGPPEGGTTITAIGTAFGGSAGLFAGDQALTGVIVDGATQIHGTTPALSPGTLLDVLVLNADASFEALGRAFFVDFIDAPAGSLFHDSIETIFRKGVTAGCGAGQYCVARTVTRAQMAVFLVRALTGPTFLPSRATGQVFGDVVCEAFGSSEIEWIAAKGITAGCGGGEYCPTSPVKRAQMAVFLLKALLGSGYVPPPAVGLFGDVPTSDAFAPWIEDLATRGIAAGCGNGDYCPDAPTTRGQMAAFVERTFFSP